MSDSEIVFRPGDLAGRGFDAAEVSFAGVFTAVDAVEVSFVLDRGGVLAGERVVVSPDFGNLGPLQRTEFRPDVVAGRHEQPVVEHQRRRGVDGGAALAKGKEDFGLVGCRIEGHAVESRNEDGLFLAANFCDGWGRIAADFAGSLPERLASGGVERDKTGIIAHDVHDELPSHQNRRAPRAEVSFVPVIVHVQFAGPEFFSVGQRDAVQITCGPEDIDLVLVYERDAAGAKIGVDAPAVTGFEFSLPFPLATGHVERFDQFLLSHSVEENHSLSDRHRPRVATADFGTPGDFWGRRKRGRQLFTLRVAVASRPEDLGPVAGLAC